MKTFTKPLLIASDGSERLLDRRPLTLNGGVESERWLQDALFRSPEALPVADIDPHIGPLIPICREIETGSGPADILYLTPTGQVVLVETKLWRNPEARREVVGQILDYAKQLTTWTYDVLDQKAALAEGESKNYLLRCLKNRYPEADEAAFVDGVGQSLRTGDFLLLIVGDGIRYGAEELVRFLDRYGHLRFGLGLLEVAAHSLPDGGTILQPRILAKTEILQRFILMGPSGPVPIQQAMQAEESADPNSAQREWFMAFWAEFIAKLKLDDKSLMPTEPAKATNQYFSMPPPGGMSWISAYIAQGSGKAGVYLTFSKSYDRGAEIYALLESDREGIESEVGAKLSWEKTGNKVYVGSPTLNISDLNVADERNRVTTYLADMTQRMIRSLRPRLDAATRTDM